MGEIKMNDPDLREIASALRYLEGREDECSSNRRKWGEIAAAIEEQVKPAVEEPLDFGSLVRASNPERKNVLWQQAPHIGGHYWINAYRDVEVWSELTDVEVLRVGLGGDHGARGIVNQIHECLQKLLVKTPLVVEQRAYEKAIQAVEELAP